MFSRYRCSPVCFVDAVVETFVSELESSESSESRSARLSAGAPSLSFSRVPRRGFFFASGGGGASRRDVPVPLQAPARRARSDWRSRRPAGTRCASPSPRRRRPSFFSAKRRTRSPPRAARGPAGAVAVAEQRADSGTQLLGLSQASDLVVHLDENLAKAFFSWVFFCVRRRRRR